MSAERREMTEARWTGPEVYPSELIRFLVSENRASDRKLRLFACSCGRVIWMPQYLCPGLMSLLSLAEQFADGDTAREALEATFREERDLDPPLPDDEYYPEPHRTAVEVVYAAADTSPDPERPDRNYDPIWASRAANLEMETSANMGGDRWHIASLQSHRLRCIFRNPFRPAPPAGAWLTPTAVSIAQGIYADRAFDHLPILADALQDAGCDAAELLAHCRGPGPHVRGCWVIDLVLGKD